jgi:oleate hydratase
LNLAEIRVSGRKRGDLVTNQDSNSNSNSNSKDTSAIYLVGAGIASLAAAAFLIRDGDVPGKNITILEASANIGGSLDAAGNSKDGYSMRGGRMLESQYLCTYELFSSIPTLDGSKTVTQEIFDWNETIKTSSKSRLFRDGHRVDSPAFGLSEKHILTIERLERPTSQSCYTTTNSRSAADVARWVRSRQRTGRERQV